MSKYISYTKNISIPYASNDLEILNDKLLPIEKQVNNEKLLNAGRTLDEIDNISALKYHHKRLELPEYV